MARRAYASILDRGRDDCERTQAKRGDSGRAWYGKGRGGDRDRDRAPCAYIGRGKGTGRLGERIDAGVGLDENDVHSS